MQFYELNNEYLECFMWLFMCRMKKRNWKREIAYNTQYTVHTHITFNAWMPTLFNCLVINPFLWLIFCVLFAPKKTQRHIDNFTMLLLTTTLSNNCIFVYSIDLSVAIPLTHYILIIAFRKYTHSIAHIYTLQLVYS